MATEIDQWIRKLAINISQGRGIKRVPPDKMDHLLSWLSGKESEVSIQLSRVFAETSVDDLAARQKVLALLDGYLFDSEKATPLHRLGLDSSATRPEIKIRYRKLMQIYHPDRAVLGPTISNNRAEVINTAYADLADHQPADVIESETWANTSMFQFDKRNSAGRYSGLAKSFAVRSRIGSVSSFKRKLNISLGVVSLVLLGLLLISSLDFSEPQKQIASSASSDKIKEPLNK